MKKETLFDAIGEIGDDLITEARETPKSSKGSLKRFALIAASVVLIFGIGIGTVGGLIWWNGANQGGRAGNGRTYMYYSGPVFPLTASEEADGITVERKINFDFSRIEDGYGTGCDITDSYTLKNNTDSDLTLKLSYPYSGSLRDSVEYLPKIKVSGEQVGFSLAFGADGDTSPFRMGDNYWLDCYDDYDKMLSDGSYEGSAYSDFPTLTETVTVYEITDYVIKGEGANPTLKISFNMDFKKTSVLTYGMNGGSNDTQNGYCARWFGVPAEGEYGYGDSYYIVLVGEDIDGYTLQGYQDGGCDKGEEIEITAKVTRTERMLSELIASLIDREAATDISTAKYVEELVSEETYFGLVAQSFYDRRYIDADGTVSFIENDIESIFSAADGSTRIIYVNFEVTVPAGASISVEASMFKRAHEDFVGDHKERYGYDMATSLGSRLRFTSQRASVSNTENIEISAQNFGFDIDSGITEVTLDMAVDNYWLEVRHIPKEE